MYVNGVRDNTDMINDCNGCQGCQASLENGAKCGETQTLKILREFHKLYEDKLKKIDENDEGALQLKTLMLQDWVRDLTEQNTMLVQAVEELEQEASGRVALLEEKLKQSSKANYDVMTKFHEFERLSDKNSTFCIIENYQSDINNLLEFIRRIREDGLWSTEGLNFYDLNIIDEFVSNRPCNVSDLPVVKRVVNEVVSKYKSELEMLHKEQEMQTRDIQMKDMIIQDQVEQMKSFSQNSNFCNNHDNSEFLEEMHNLRKELKYRNEEYEKLEKSMKDMREALTAEVADKHDNIVALRRECHMLEEQCRQADKQTHFKDDIIKDMRKELKHLRSKLETDGSKEIEDLKRKIGEIEKENAILQRAMNDTNNQLCNIHSIFYKFSKEQDNVEQHFNSPRDQKSFFESLVNKSDHFTLDKTKLVDQLKHAVNLLKDDVKNMISLKSKEEITTSKERIAELETSLADSVNKEALLKTKDEMICVQNDTLNIATLELKELRAKIANMEDELGNRVQEIKNLQQALKLSQDTIEELENTSKIAEEKMRNMQQAVDLYVDSINVLEHAKEKAMIEIEQQKITIRNLQDSVIMTKHQLEESQGKNASDAKEKQKIISQLSLDLAETHSQYSDCFGEVVKLAKSIECLRDSNLELQSRNFFLQQDYDMLDMKINEYREALDVMKASNNLMSSKNTVLEDIIKFLKNEMSELSSQLQVLHELLSIANNVSHASKDENLTQSIILLEQRSELLVHQLKVTKEQISREIKINDINKTRIDELEKQLENKSLELYHCEGELSSLKAALDDSLQINQEFEKKVKYTQKQVSEYEQQQHQYDEKIGSYQSEISNLNTNVVEMRVKMQNLSEMLKNKTDELLRLRAEFSVKCDSINTLLIQNENMQKEFDDERQKLNTECLYLRNKLVTYKSSFVDINEKYSRCQSVLIEGTEREMKFQQEQLEQRNKLNSELRTLQTENINLHNDIKLLTKKMDELKDSMNRPDDTAKDLDLAQEEIVELKNEINTLIQTQSTLQQENEKLNECIRNIRILKEQFENDHKQSSIQLEQCLQDLNSLRSSNQKLQDKNMQLEMEIESLQRTYSDLNREIQYKNESVMNLEQELTEAKMNRDELRAESKRVVSNVRFWLQEQKQINQQLKDTIRDKNMLIDELSSERNTLIKNIREIYEKYNNLSEELQMYQHCDKCTVRSSPLKRSVYTWGSQGSVTQESPSSSPSTMDENVFEYEDACADGKLSELTSSPIMWMQKVKNISAELQRNNQYWKKKLQQSRKHTPVKDIES